MTGFLSKNWLLYNTQKVNALCLGTFHYDFSNLCFSVLVRAWMDLPSGILVEFLKWFSTRKSSTSLFALVLWSYMSHDRLKKGLKMTSKEVLGTLNDTKNHRFSWEWKEARNSPRRPFIMGERKAWKSDLQLCYFI